MSHVIAVPYKERDTREPNAPYASEERAVAPLPPGAGERSDGKGIVIASLAKPHGRISHIGKVAPPLGQLLLARTLQVILDPQLSVLSDEGVGGLIIPPELVHIEIVLACDAASLEGKGLFKLLFLLFFWFVLDCY